MIVSTLRFGSMSSDTIAIVNASSGSPVQEDPCNRLRGVLQSRGLDWEIWPADGTELSDLAERAAASPARVVIAGGGDGTLNAVASRLAGGEKIFGVLPLGTLNHFAKDLNIPLELSAAVDNITAGNVAPVDVGDVNGQIFLNNSSIGVYPQIVIRRRDTDRSSQLSLRIFQRHFPRRRCGSNSEAFPAQQRWLVPASFVTAIIRQNFLSTANSIRPTNGKRYNYRCPKSAATQ